MRARCRCWAEEWLCGECPERMGSPSWGRQSWQSVPQSQSLQKAPAPPSSQMPSVIHTVLLPSLLPSEASPRQVFSQIA